MSWVQSLRNVVLGSIVAVCAFVALCSFVVAIASHSEPPTLPNATQAQSVAPMPDTPPDQPDPPIQEQPVRPVAPPLRVSIDQLAADYEENEISADLKYKWKSLEVYGNVLKIQRNDEGHIVVTLKNFSDFGGVVALLEDDQEDQAAALRPLRVVTLLCVGGGLIMRRPVVGKCRIEQTPPTVAPTATEQQ